MRRFAMVLILLNLALGGAQATTTTSPGSGFINCCRGDGEDAYCCRKCCWLGIHCQTDAQCRDPNLETSTLETWNADDSS